MAADKISRIVIYPLILKIKMTLTELRNQIVEKRSFLCIGLDVDLEKIPASLHQEEDPIFAFNKAIIDNTHHLAVAYKPNTAFRSEERRVGKECRYRWSTYQ